MTLVEFFRREISLWYLYLEVVPSLNLSLGQRPADSVACRGVNLRAASQSKVASSFQLSLHLDMEQANPWGCGRLSTYWIVNFWIVSMPSVHFGARIRHIIVASSALLPRISFKHNTNWVTWKIKALPDWLSLDIASMNMPWVVVVAQKASMKYCPKIPPHASADQLLMASPAHKRRMPLRSSHRPKLKNLLIFFKLSGSAQRHVTPNLSVLWTNSNRRSGLFQSHYLSESIKSRLSTIDRFSIEGNT
jgi:hypothetical protein